MQGSVRDWTEFIQSSRRSLAKAGPGQRLQIVGVSQVQWFVHRLGCSFSFEFGRPSQFFLSGNKNMDCIEYQGRRGYEQHKARPVDYVDDSRVWSTECCRCKWLTLKPTLPVGLRTASG
jgi:hypothetical protein